MVIIILYFFFYFIKSLLNSIAQPLASGGQSQDPRLPRPSPLAASSNKGG